MALSNQVLATLRVVPYTQLESYFWVREGRAKAQRAQNELTRIEMLARLRPILVLSSYNHPTAGGARQFFLENHGPGVALKIVVRSRVPTNESKQTEVGMAHNILGPGENSLLFTNGAGIEAYGLHIEYESADGRKFATIIEPGQPKRLPTGHIRDERCWRIRSALTNPKPAISERRRLGRGTHSARLNDIRKWLNAMLVHLTTYRTVPAYKVGEISAMTLRKFENTQEPCLKLS